MFLLISFDSLNCFDIFILLLIMMIETKNLESLRRELEEESGLKISCTTASIVSREIESRL